ncbi:hypothetical protein AX15_004634 [Amanita polypyramis BW_CC]|nr:hypothetical protein AX15_004634 [Amanita polypyramis BW_CC]
MLAWLLVLPLPLPVLAGLDQTYGVHPSVLSRYAPLKPDTWKCLDGSKEIPWVAVNDDFCDCPDGSDEPGTSACPNSIFYCQNVGHVGASIPSSRVNDGLCEPQCCDGSDERAGACPNTCKEAGEAYRKRREAELKVQRQGSKVRSGYIAFALKEKTRLEGEIHGLKDEIEEQEKEVTRLRDVADRVESLSAAALEHRKESPLYQTLINQANALKSLRREYRALKEHEGALGDILNNLRTGYNPNYQDMAVLEAVRGWEQMSDLPHINEAGKDHEQVTDEGGIVSGEGEQEHERGEWSSEDFEANLDTLLNTDYESLLLAHEEHIDAPLENSSYSFFGQYEEIKDTFVSWLRKLGIVGESSSSTSTDSSRAHQALTRAENGLTTLKNDKQSAEDQLSKLFDLQHFGAKGEWKNLDGTCMETVTGDYTYEVCLFGEARQKSLNGGSTFSLGKFTSWNPSADPGEPTYYQKQLYQHGARCWNGPERSVVLLLTCGTENTLTSVVELEKCEYQFTGTTPALCLPPPKEKREREDREEL